MCLDCAQEPTKNLYLFKYNPTLLSTEIQFHPNIRYALSLRYYLVFVELQPILKPSFPAVGSAYGLIGFFHADSITVSRIR
jgi:hypothetical protein